MSKNKRIRFKISQRISDHLIGAILIFTSVFFAFWLTEYRESRNEAAKLKISLQHIASEMEYNHKRIASIFDYHTSLILEIDSLKNQNISDWKKLYGHDLSKWNGMQMPMLRSTAYQTFLNSGVNDKTKFELAKSLADIYNTQSIIERLDNSFFDIATADRELTALPRVRHLTRLYVSVIPEVIMFYQHQGKSWLSEYGYNMNIENDELKNIVEKRMTYQ